MDPNSWFLTLSGLCSSWSKVSQGSPTVQVFLNDIFVAKRPHILILSRTNNLKLLGVLGPCFSQTPHVKHDILSYTCLKFNKIKYLSETANVFCPKNQFQSTISLNIKKQWLLDEIIV